MKKYFFITLLVFCARANVAGQMPGDWYNRSFEDDGVYGASINKARLSAKGMKPVKTVTVALIGYGIDIEHRDIKKSIWVNPKEKLNGKDDDKNGWTDDMHGWNFLGNSTESLNNLSHEGDREFLRLKDKYAHFLDLLPVDGKVYKYDSTTQLFVETDFPENREEFDYFRSIFPESTIAESYGAVTLSKAIVAFINDADKKMKQKFPGKELKRSDFQAFADWMNVSPFEKIMYELSSLMFMSSGNDSWDQMVEYANTKYIPYQTGQLERTLKNVRADERKIVGDNVFDLNDKNYGNNNLRSENAGYGTMLAGIIAGHGNATGIKGVAENVKIISLRVDAGDYGESYVKDIALAIRYAVDKGADIIQLGKTNTFYPKPHSQWVDEALRYAEQKGVLVVIPVMDLSYNMDNQPFYPNRHLKGGDLSNIIMVAASDSLGNPYKSVNFSKTELDLFAPGVDVKSCYIDSTYAIGSGSAFAAAMVTGAASFIKSYYPGITPDKMRKLLMENVTLREEAEVEKQFYPYRNGKKERLTTDLFLFQELCASEGILNLEKAFNEAKKLK